MVTSPRVRRDALVTYRGEPTCPSWITIADLRPYLRRSGEAPFSPHRHDFNQAIWITAGKGTHHVDFRLLTYGPESLMWIPPGAVHHFERDSSARGVLLHFNSDLVVQNDRDHQRLSRLRVKSRNAGRAQALERSQTSTLKSLVTLLKQESESNARSGQDQIVQSLARTLVIFIDRWLVDEGCAEPSLYPIYFSFFDLVERWFRDHRPIPDYAQELQVSVKTLSRSTQDAAGTSPGAIIIDRLLLEAKRLLVHSNTPVKSVAYELGFTDAAYFSRLFRRHAGLSPQKFRAASGMTK